jgi:hypothetical protein
LPKDITEKDLYLTIKDYEVLLMKGYANARINGGEKIIFPWKEYKKLSKPYIDEIPNLWTLKDNPDDLKKIKKDFQNITNEDIEKNAETINKYYDAICAKKSYHIVEKLLKESKKLKILGTNDSMIGISCIWDIINLSINPRAGISMFEAGDDALSHYGGLDDSKNNSGQHMAWSALTYKNLIIAGFSRPEALMLDLQLLSMHEWCSENATSSNMDHHNNGYGRKWAHQNTSWGIWFLRDLPSDSEIFNEMDDVSNNRNDKYPDEISDFGDFYDLVPSYDRAIYLN